MLLTAGRKQNFSRHDILVLQLDKFKAIGAFWNFEQNEQLDTRSTIFKRYYMSCSAANYYKKLNKWILLTGGVFCTFGVIVGAFGAHALKPLLSEKAMGWIETGVFYHFIHGLALIACGIVKPSRASVRSAKLFSVGIALFSGSLYLMALTGVNKLGVITPIGGLCLIGGWISFCHMAWCHEQKDENST